MSRKKNYIRGRSFSFSEAASKDVASGGFCKIISEKTSQGSQENN